jgi:hypothetical protein
VRPAQARQIAERKALLASRAMLDRARMTVAVHDIRTIVAPPVDPSRAAAARSRAAVLIGLAIPLFGTTRVGRWLRIGSWALAAWRVARNWHAAR